MRLPSARRYGLRAPLAMRASVRLLQASGAFFGGLGVREWSAGRGFWWRFALVCLWWADLGNVVEWSCPTEEERCGPGSRTSEDGLWPARLGGGIQRSNFSQLDRIQAIANWSVQLRPSKPAVLRHFDEKDRQEGGGWCEFYAATSARWSCSLDAATRRSWIAAPSRGLGAARLALGTPRMSSSNGRRGR